MNNETQLTKPEHNKAVQVARSNNITITHAQELVLRKSEQKRLA